MSIMFNLKFWWHGFVTKHKVDWVLHTCPECDYGGKAFPIGSEFDLEKHLKEMNSRPEWKKKLDHVCWWIRHGIWRKIDDMPREHYWACQRIKRGYSDRDVWGFDYFLADIISKGIRDLQEQVHGYPPCLCGDSNPNTMAVYGTSEAKDQEDKEFEEWKKILGKIAKTFETAKAIQDHDIMYISSKNFSPEWYADSIAFAERLNKKDLGHDYHVMTLDEIKEYEEGWYLFREYFFHLWD